MTKTYDRVDDDRLGLILESGVEVPHHLGGILVRDLARTLEQDRKDAHESISSHRPCIDEVRALELAKGDLESQVGQLKRDVDDWKNAKGMATTAANDLAADNEKLFEQIALLTRATGGVRLVFQVSGDVKVVAENPEAMSVFPVGDPIAGNACRYGCGRALPTVAGRNQHESKTHGGMWHSKSET